MKSLAFLLALLVLQGCKPEISREPVIVGSKSDADSVLLSELIAQKLERGGCSVERRFNTGDVKATDAALFRGAIDVYVESHHAAMVAVVGENKSQPGADETDVRTAYIKRDLVWAPRLGVGDLAPVFRKKVDEKCRSASRLLMRSAYSLDPQKLASLRRDASSGDTSGAVKRFLDGQPK